MNVVIRKGKLRDLNAVRGLAIRSVKYGISDVRRIPVEVVQQYTRKALADLEATIFQKNFKLIIAEDADTNKIIGYLMLVLNEIEGSTGELQSLIHDLAVDPAYWGKYVVDRLMARAEEITKENKLKYIVGEITANNKRPLIYSQVRLCYNVERHQIVKYLGDDAKQKRPRHIVR